MSDKVFAIGDTTDTTKRFYINGSTGNVGINVYPTQDERLNVNGHTKTTSLNVGDHALIENGLNVVADSSFNDDLEIYGSVGIGGIKDTSYELNVHGNIKGNITGNLTGDIIGDTTIGGNLKVTGNNIKSSGDTTALTFSGGAVTTGGNLEIGGDYIKSAHDKNTIKLDGNDVTVAGNVTVNGNMIKSSTGTVAALTLSGAGVKTGGDLEIGGSRIKSGPTSNTITLDGNNMTVLGNVTASHVYASGVTSMFYGNIRGNVIRAAPNNTTMINAGNGNGTFNEILGKITTPVQPNITTMANLTTTGTLSNGSIASGFGIINNGSSSITTTGAISGDTITGVLQTAVQPNITTMSNLTSTGTLNSGSITSGFGSINNGGSGISAPYGVISGMIIKGGSGQETMIDNNGNIGIKRSTNDSYPLWVNGTTRIDGVLRLEGAADPLWSGLSSLLSNTYIRFGAAGANSDWAYLRQIGESNAMHIALDFHDDGNDAGFSIRDVRSDVDDTITTRFIVERSGNVGIGTDNPTQKLDVNGTIQSTGLILNGTCTLGSNTIEDDNGDLTITIPDNKLIVKKNISPNNDEIALELDAGGNLDVHGNIYFKNGSMLKTDRPGSANGGGSTGSINLIGMPNNSSIEIGSNTSGPDKIKIHTPTDSGQAVFIVNEVGGWGTSKPIAQFRNTGEVNMSGNLTVDGVISGNGSGLTNLSSSLTLNAGSNVSISQSGTTYTISSTDTNTDTNTHPSNITWPGGEYPMKLEQHNSDWSRGIEFRFGSYASVIRGRRNGGNAGVYVHGSTSSTSLWSSSDDRLKHNELPVENALETINMLNIQQYDKTLEFKDANYTGEVENAMKEIGVIAQDVKALDDSLLNQCVMTPDNEETEPYSINYNSLSCISMKAIQELSDSLNAEKVKTANLESELAAIKAHLGI